MSLLYGVHRLDGPLHPADGLHEVAAMGLTAARSTLSSSADGFLRSEQALPGGPAWGVWGRPLAAALPGAGPASAGPDVHLIAQCRLDNRADLLRAFHAAPGDSRPDIELIAEAYARYGVDCVSHLVGDWAFALWDAARQRLLLARDATGNSALFWWQGGGQLFFATGLQALLAAGSVPRQPNPRWIAGLLTLFSDPAYPTATAFQDVHALPAGHLLLAERGDIQIQRWWRPEELPPLDDAPLAELEERFLAVYDDAVRQRLRRSGGSVAATLSGGLDSGSVVAWAAPALAEQGQVLTAYVHVPRFDAAAANPRRITNEWSMAQATAAHVGHVRAIACPSERSSPLDGIRQWLEIGGVPPQAASNWYWLLDIAQQASAAGSQVLLTGQGGNSTVSFTGSGNLWPALKAGRLQRAWQELRSEGSGWVPALHQRLVKPALRPIWRRLQAARKPATEGRAQVAFGLLHPELARSLNLADAMARAGHDASFRLPPSARRMTAFRLGLTADVDSSAQGWAALSNAFGIDASDPTRDQRLVELCWRLPDELFWAHGRQRGLVRSGMRDQLPALVRDCDRKGLQSSDLHARLSACRDDLLGEIDALTHDARVCEWIDMPRLAVSARDALDGGSPHPGGTVAASHMLRALAAAMFVAREGQRAEERPG